MKERYKNPAVIKATERLDKLLSYLIANSEADEDWKEIEWADGYYFISSKGRALSLCNKLPHKLKSFMCNGYLCVSIYGYDRRINRLVAQAFIPNPDNTPIVHHINHDKTDNRVSNLSWATHSENTTAYFDSKKQSKEQIESEAPVG